MILPTRSALAAACLLLSLAVLAQPRVTPWSEGPVPIPTLRLVADCERPPGTVLTGDSLFFEIDTTDGYGARVTIENDDLNEFGRPVVVDLGARVRYRAFPDVGTGGTDAFTVVACRPSSADCRTTEFAVTVAEAGRSRDTTFALRGGLTAVVPVLRPAGELFCESVTTIGTYEAADRRTASLTEEGLVYASSRVPGVDELRVVACGVGGVCDTTLISVDVIAETLELPICDDFSGAGGLPNPRIWLEDDVSVGDGFAVSPPSVGVATFDGLDADGVPYGEGFGPSDALTSTRIALGGAPADLYLKYYLQIGGLGQAPEREDALYVEGRRADGTWETLEVHRGSPSSTPEAFFTFHALPIRGDALLHDEFQVRFRTEANRGGENDIWNLDYVRLEEGADSTFADIAIVSTPADVLTPYTAVPYEHFVADPVGFLAPASAITVNNLFPEANNVSSSRFTVTAADGTVVLDDGLLFGQQLLLDPGLNTAVNDLAPATIDGLAEGIAGLDRAAAARLTTRYTLGIDADQADLACVLANDTTETVTLVGDVFAYDDGTAEGGLTTGGQGEIVVQRFVTAVEDTLRGIRFRFPRLGGIDADEQFINLHVYIGELDSFPEFERNIVRPFFPGSPDGEQRFTTFQLQDITGAPVDVIIPPGEFYVGWQQSSNEEGPVPVGLDYSRDRTDEIFANFDGRNWVPLPEVLSTLSAALMVRPVFSSTPPGNTSPVGELDRTGARTGITLEVSPNPTGGLLRIGNLPDASLGGTLDVHDLTGRLVRRAPSGPELDLGGLPSGLYRLTLRDRRGLPVGRASVVVE